MDSPKVRSTKEVILRDTYVTGSDRSELKKAENCLEFIDVALQSIEDINLHIADLNHIGIGKTIHDMKPVLMNMGYESLYRHATALENEFVNQIISFPRPNIEDFVKEVSQATETASTQLEGMRVSLI